MIHMNLRSQTESRKFCSVVLNSLASVALIFGVASCRTRNAEMSEAPDKANLPAQLGLPDRVNWQELKDVRSGNLGRTPWSDTWWSFPKLGIAHRWTLKDKQNDLLSDVPPNLHTMIVQMRDVLRTKDLEKIALLSPAEKYEWVRSKGTLNLDQIMTLTAPELDLAAAENLAPYLAKSSPQGRKAFNLLSEIRLDELEKKSESIIAAKYVELNRLAAELSKMRTPSILEDVSGYAARIADDAVSVRNGPFLIADAWKTYAEFLPRFPSIHMWRWMGICHGWSLAALNELAPKHAVLVNVGEYPVLFSEGDIRGLLTKVWAEQSAPARLAGTRCDVDYVELAKNQTDSLGRVLDGRICDLHDPYFSCSQGSAIDFVDKDFEDGMITYKSRDLGASQLDIQLDIQLDTKRDSKADTLKIGVIVSTFGANSAFHIMEYDSLAAFAEAKRTNTPGRPRTIQNLSVCRDLNPMTFHLANRYLIRDGGPGYVIDRARGAEVWNQPVFEYASKIIPAKTRSGKMTGINDLVPVAEIDDLFGSFRAKGSDYRTAFLLQVETTIQYVEDSGPRVTYPSEDVTPMTVQYTLEFDEDKVLRGGEWGLIPTPENANDQDIARWRNSDFAPDFVWMVGKDQLPRGGSIDYDLIKKIHACSLKETGVKQLAWPTTKENITYVPCSL
jgi:hypothetical protein